MKKSNLFNKDALWISGAKFSALCAGIKYKDRQDLILIYLEPGSTLAGVFTKSYTRSAPVNWSKKIIENSSKRDDEAYGILVNSGNANAFTGERGHQDVKNIMEALSGALSISLNSVLMASTGVIGEFLPYKKIVTAIPKLIEGLSIKKMEDCSRAIMTTDTYPKFRSTTIILDGQVIKIVGIAKGSGMIAPNMATMLGYFFTDALLPPNILKRLLIDVCEKTFNSITVDGDTSTNDMVSFISTRKIACEVKSINDDKLKQFKMDLNKVALQLAKKIILDGEGAKKLIQVSVFNAFNYKEAKKVAMSIANSPLVKTAVAGEDANWGRIIMAIGKTDAKINQKKISLKFGDIMVIKNGEMQTNYKEANLSKYLKKKEIEINVNLSVGKAISTIWTCDLTKEYISINADYRS